MNAQILITNYSGKIIEFELFDSFFAVHKNKPVPEEIGITMSVFDDINNNFLISFTDVDMNLFGTKFFKFIDTCDYDLFLKYILDNPMNVKIDYFHYEYLYFLKTCSELGFKKTPISPFPIEIHNSVLDGMHPVLFKLAPYEQLTVKFYTHENYEIFGLKKKNNLPQYSALELKGFVK